MTCAKCGEVWRMSPWKWHWLPDLIASSQLLMSNTAHLSSALECDHTKALSPCWCCLIILLLWFLQIYGEICQERAELWGGVFISLGRNRKPLCIWNPLSLGTLFAFASSMHIPSLDSEQALTRVLTYTCTCTEEQ